MNLAQLKKVVPFWLETLNLREWTVTVHWGTRKEMQDCIGRNFFSVEELQSEVVIAKDTAPSEREETLVHELLHLVFDGHKQVEAINAYDPLHERALNRTAKALMMLAHRQDKA